MCMIEEALKDTEEEIIKKALDKYGQTLQITTAMEELGELIAACNQYFFRKRSPVSNLISELSDVELSCKTLRLILNSDSEIDYVKKCKLTRLEEKIKNGK